MRSDYSPRQPNDRYALSERWQEGLQFVNVYGDLTAVQLAKLLDYAPASLKLVQRGLRAVRAHGYLECRRMTLPVAVGSSPLLWSLTRRGRSLLRRHGVPIERQTRRDAGEQGSLFERHFVATTDILVNATCLGRVEARIELDELRTERDLKRQRLRAQVFDPVGNQERARAICPDAWLRFSQQLPARRLVTAVWVECDLGTEERKAWAGKVLGIVRFLEQGYRQHFGPFLPTVAVVAIPGQQRCAQLVRWTEDVLTATGLARWGRLFCYTAMAPDATPPVRFWTARVWRQPYQSEMVPLLDLANGAIRTVRLPRAA